MRRHFGTVQATTHRRFSVTRVARGSVAGGSLATFIFAPQCMQKRSYYNQQGNGGYPPPPAPPSTYQYGGQPYYAPYPPMQQEQYAPRPQTSFSGELGTQERPIVVTSAPQKASWATRFWMLLLLGIGASCLLSLIDELSDRFNPTESNAKAGGFPRGAGGLGNMFGSSEVKPVNLDTLETTFDQIRGCDEAKKELEEIVEFLRDPDRFRELGGRLPKGALLVGPPGCGKTLLAKAVAKEAGVNFFYATGSEFDEMFVGVGSRRVRELFAAAKAAAPALIFIDEIDALGGKRSRSDHAYSRMTLNQLLAEMDGFESNEAVIVLAATNTPDSLDKALTRPGRLDSTISIDPPDMKGRAEVAQVYLNKIKADASVNAMDIARGTTGFTGAELSNLVNLAAIRAAVLNKKSVTNDEIEYAKDRVMMGAESKKVIPEEERRVTAFHEGGHALAAILLKDQGADPVHKATIVPRGNGIMGLVQQLPEKDRYSQSKRQCLARLKVCVAGRVGEELLLGPEDITTGASSDFQQATSMARHMVRRFGFNSAIGFVDYESADSPEGAYISDDTKQRIEKEVNTLLNEAYSETKDMLITHKKELDQIAQALLKHETLTGADLNLILKGEPLPDRAPRLESAAAPPRAGGSSSGAQKGKSQTVPIS